MDIEKCYDIYQREIAPGQYQYSVEFIFPNVDSKPSRRFWYDEYSKIFPYSSLIRTFTSEAAAREEARKYILEYYTSFSVWEKISNEN